MKLIRVFPRKTNATPDDELVRIGPPTHPMFDEADEVHVSVAFTWDIPKAEQLAREWEVVTKNVILGGPAYRDPRGAFVPGVYIKKGYVITSRGCPNHCWFCRAWKNEGNTVRELKIHDGWNLLDNNIFACSKEHQQAVFEMLLRQPEQPRFTGGLEAARLTPWHIDWLLKLKPEYIYFAYDEPSDYEPLINAAALLKDGGVMKGHMVGCYVLIGYKNDTFEKAEKRLINTVHLGYMPQAMLYDRGVEWSEYERDKWQSFQREWANKVIVGSKMKQYAVAQI